MQTMHLICFYSSDLDLMWRPVLAARESIDGCSTLQESLWTRVPLWCILGAVLGPAAVVACTGSHSRLGAAPRHCYRWALRQAAGHGHARSAIKPDSLLTSLAGALLDHLFSQQTSPVWVYSTFYLKHFKIIFPPNLDSQEWQTIKKREYT